MSKLVIDSNRSRGPIARRGEGSTQVGREAPMSHIPRRGRNAFRQVTAKRPIKQLIIQVLMFWRADSATQLNCGDVNG